MGLRSDGEDKLGFQKTFFFFPGQLFLLLEAGAPVVLGAGFSLPAHLAGGMA